MSFTTTSTLRYLKGKAYKATLRYPQGEAFGAYYHLLFLNSRVYQKLIKRDIKKQIIALLPFYHSSSSMIILSTSASSSQWASLFVLPI